MAKFFASTNPHRAATAAILGCVAAGFAWIAFIVFAPNAQYTLMAGALVLAAVCAFAAWHISRGRRATSRWDAERAAPTRKWVPGLVAIAVAVVFVIVWWNGQ